MSSIVQVNKDTLLYEAASECVNKRHLPHAIASMLLTYKEKTIVECHGLMSRRELTIKEAAFYNSFFENYGKSISALPNEYRVKFSLLTDWQRRIKAYIADEQKFLENELAQIAAGTQQLVTRIDTFSELLKKQIKVPDRITFEYDGSMPLYSSIDELWMFFVDHTLEKPTTRFSLDNLAFLSGRQLKFEKYNEDYVPLFVDAVLRKTHAYGYSSESGCFTFPHITIDCTKVSPKLFWRLINKLVKEQVTNLHITNLDQAKFTAYNIPAFVTHISSSYPRCSYTVSGPCENNPQFLPQRRRNAALTALTLLLGQKCPNSLCSLLPRNVEKIIIQKVVSTIPASQPDRFLEKIYAVFEEIMISRAAKMLAV